MGSKVGSSLWCLVCLTGCFTAPEGTEALSENSDLVAIAEWTADYLDAPANCRNWDDVGIYWATSPEDYYRATGRCPVTLDQGSVISVTIDGVQVCDPTAEISGSGRAITFLYVNTWDSVIVFSSSLMYTDIVAHEIIHHLLTCMHGGDTLGGGNENHSNLAFDEVETLLYYNLDETNQAYGIHFHKLVNNDGFVE